MTTSAYLSDGQQRLLALVRLLAGNEVHGLAPGEIAKAQGCSASLVTRDLANLKEAGFAEQIVETGRWRLGPTLVQVALAHSRELEKAERKLAETKQRFSRAI
jgi:DNA-binding IclR family transcriptional regulator